MNERTAYRLGDIVDAVEKIGMLLEHKTFADLQSDPFLRAAFERFLEILSEASRHIPDEMKRSAPELPWRRIADIGNHLRHAYNRVDTEILWLLHADGELKRLKDVAGAFAARLKRPE